MNDLQQTILNHIFYQVGFIANYFLYTKKKKLPRWREVSYLILCLLSLIWTVCQIINAIHRTTLTN